MTKYNPPYHYEDKDGNEVFVDGPFPPGWSESHDARSAREYNPPSRDWKPDPAQLAKYNCRCGQGKSPEQELCNDCAAGAWVTPEELGLTRQRESPMKKALQSVLWAIIGVVALFIMFSAEIRSIVEIMLGR